MKRKRLILCFLLLVLLSALAVVGGHYYFRRPAINKETFAKIKQGVTTKQEVEAMLGRPTGPTTFQYSSISLEKIPQPVFLVDCWRGTADDEGTIEVWYDEWDTASITIYSDDHDPGLIEKINKWLGLQSP